LRTGNTKSCGCYAQEKAKENGKYVGSLPKKAKDYTLIDNPFYTFIQRTDKKDISNSFFWIVQCKRCGKQYEEVPSQIISTTRARGNNPCSCWKHLSKGEQKIINLLLNNNISFSQQVTFKDCLSPLGNPLKFDFFIEQKYLIEFDGE